MSRHSRNQEITQATREEFPKPVAWALKWDGLYETIDQQDPGPAAEHEPKAKNRPEKFPEPRGWAAKWDGSVLSPTQESHNR